MYMFDFFHICLWFSGKNLAFAHGLNLTTVRVIILNTAYLGHFCFMLTVNVISRSALIVQNSLWTC